MIKLIINLDKSVVIYYGKNNAKFGYYIRNRQIPVNSFTKDLGLIVDEKLDFMKHICSVKRKSFLTVNGLLKSVKSRDLKLLSFLIKTYTRIIPIN